jgi:hypothetical protein
VGGDRLYHAFAAMGCILRTPVGVRESLAEWRGSELIYPADKALGKAPPLHVSQTMIASTGEPWQNPFSCEYMAAGRVLHELGEKAHRHGQVGTGTDGEPIQTTHHTLIWLDDFWFIVGCNIASSNRIDGETRLVVGATHGIAFAHVLFFEHGFNPCCLGDGYGEVVVGAGLPVVAFSEEPNDVAHPVNFEFEGGEGLFDDAFHRIANSDVRKVVNVDAQIEGRLAFNENAHMGCASKGSCRR